MSQTRHNASRRGSVFAQEAGGRIIVNLRNRAFKTGTILCVGLLFGLVAVIAQDSVPRRKSSNDAEASGAEAAIVIKRRALVLEDPRTYQVPLRLEPAKSIALIAPVDGIVQSVHVKPGDQLPSQGDVIRMDDQRTELLIRKAKAEVTARELERKLAQSNGGSADAVALAEANLEAAKAAYDLAELEHQKMIVRGGFAGTILKVHVVPGQFVRAGEAVAELGDLSNLVAHVPAGRAQVKPGDKISVTVENSSVPAVVETLFPPPPHYEPLGPLVESLTMAQIQIQKEAGTLHH